MGQTASLPSTVQPTVPLQYRHPPQDGITLPQSLPSAQVLQVQHKLCPLVVDFVSNWPACCLMNVSNFLAVHALILLCCCCCFLLFNSFLACWLLLHACQIWACQLSPPVFSPPPNAEQLYFLYQACQVLDVPNTVVCELVVHQCRFVVLVANKKGFIVYIKEI